MNDEWLELLFIIVGGILALVLIIAVSALVGAAALAGAGLMSVFVGGNALKDIILGAITAWGNAQGDAKARPISAHTFPFLDRIYQPQPAQMLYPLDQGWYIVFQFSRKLGNSIDSDVKAWFSRAGTWFKSGSSASEILETVWYLTLAIGTFVGSLFYYVFSIVFGLLFILFFSLLMLAWTLLIMTIMGSVGIVSWIYSHYYRLFNRCPKCHTQSRIAIYECPQCNTRHTRLWPSAYGIFQHTCQCGKKLSTIHYLGRKDYVKVCPVCSEIMHGYGSTIHIPIFGGPSAGKSHYITAAVSALLDEYQSLPSVEITFPDPDEGKHYKVRRNLLRDHRNLPKTSKNDRDSVDGYNIEIRREKRSEPNLLYVYDMMGEHAGSVDDSISQQFLSFKEGGIMLIIDPFAFPQLHRQYKDNADLKRLKASTVSPDSVISNLINALEARRKQRINGIHKTRLAVIVTKVDALDLCQRIDDALAATAIPEHFVKTQTDNNAQKVQAFLYMLDPNLVQMLHANFKEVRYFPVSSVWGQSVGDGVLVPLLWLIEPYKVFGKVVNANTIE